jgi:hypothetical protein
MTARAFQPARDLPRIGLLCLLGWWSLQFWSGSTTWCFLDYVNLAFHEAGHVFLAFAGTTVHYLGGTIGQIAVPGILSVWFLKKARSPFGSAFCVWWIGESLINVSIYMADARNLELPLVGGGDHDWNELFYRFGLLSEPSVAAVSGTTRFLGALTMLAGITWGAVLAFKGDPPAGAEESATPLWTESIRKDRP